MKKYLDVANSVSHKRVKYQFQIPNIMTYTKMTNVIKFGDLKICILRSNLCHFCVERYIKYLKLIFCKFVKYSISYICKKNHIFLKLINRIFEFF